MDLLRFKNPPLHQRRLLWQERCQIFSHWAHEAAEKNHAGAGRISTWSVYGQLCWSWRPSCWSLRPAHNSSQNPPNSQFQHCFSQRFHELRFDKWLKIWPHSYHGNFRWFKFKGRVCGLLRKPVRRGFLGGLKWEFTTAVKAGIMAFWIQEKPQNCFEVQ